MPSFAISFFRLRKASKVLVLALASFLLSVSTVRTETESVRVGRHFLYTPGKPYAGLGSIAVVLEQLNTDMQNYVTGFRGCPDIVVRDLNDGTERDELRDTWTGIQTFRVFCWAALNFDPDVAVVPTGPSDRITPEMIREIMAMAQQLSGADEAWAKSLFTFFGGTITCKDKERCRLQSPEGGDWANYSLNFDLLLARGQDRFIAVTDAYWGREALVYGVWWREEPAGGRVMSVYPVMYWVTGDRQNATSWQRTWR